MQHKIIAIQKKTDLTLPLIAAMILPLVTVMMLFPETQDALGDAAKKLYLEIAHHIHSPQGKVTADLFASLIASALSVPPSTPLQRLAILFQTREYENFSEFLKSNPFKGLFTNISGKVVGRSLTMLFKDFLIDHKDLITLIPNPVMRIGSVVTVGVTFETILISPFERGFVLAGNTPQNASQKSWGEFGLTFARNATNPFLALVIRKGLMYCGTPSCIAIGLGGLGSGFTTNVFDEPLANMRLRQATAEDCKSSGEYRLPIFDLEDNPSAAENSRCTQLSNLVRGLLSIPSRESILAGLCRGSAIGLSYMIIDFSNPYISSAILSIFPSPEQVCDP